MKKSSCWTVKASSAVLALAVAGVGLAGLYVAAAQVAPKQPSLADFDRRATMASPAAGVPPDQREAVRRLEARVPGLRVDLHPLFGAPQFVRSTRGFLSGPDGQ